MTNSLLPMGDWSGWVSKNLPETVEILKQQHFGEELCLRNHSRNLSYTLSSSDAPFMHVASMQPSMLLYTFHSAKSLLSSSPSTDLPTFIWDSSNLQTAAKVLVSSLFAKCFKCICWFSSRICAMLAPNAAYYDDLVFPDLPSCSKAHNIPLSIARDVSSSGNGRGRNIPRNRKRYIVCLDNPAFTQLRHLCPCLWHAGSTKRAKQNLSSLSACPRC